jgi:hypothetical protein
MFETPLVEAAFSIWEGDLDAAVDWLVRMGATVVSRDDSGTQVTLRGVTGVTVGLLKGLDPVNAAVQVGLLLAGQVWPRAFPSLMKRVNVEWRGKVKERREKGEDMRGKGPEIQGTLW